MVKLVHDLSIEYKVTRLNDNSGVYYCCHDSLLQPNGFAASETETDIFDTSYNGMVYFI